MSARAASALVLLATLLAAPDAHALRRFAVIVGNNRGGDGTKPLRYAEDDARRMFDILVRLGGVLPEDAQLLLGREADDLWEALDRAERRGVSAKAGGEEVALLVYFSGHAKDGALRLGPTEAPLDKLKEKLSASKLDVRVAVLDACRSGAITRTKGARLAPAFEVDDGSKQGAKGYVILTSSSGDEDSQESDALQGSFFSHYLDSALLGSGDSSGDGRVTLSEAYAYAYAHTVAQTASTASGVQHPTYAYELAGNGDLVMTDVAVRREGLLVPAPAPDGTYLIVDDQGAIAAEVDKRAAADRRIALAPGDYVVTRRLTDHLRLGSLRVRSGELAVLEEAMLRDAPFSDDPVKGSLEVQERLSTHPVIGAGFGVLSFLGSPKQLFVPSGVVELHLDLEHLISDRWGLGLGLAFGTNSSELDLDGAARPFKFGVVGATTDVTRELAPSSSWNPYGSIRGSWILLTRTFDDPHLPKQFYSTFMPGLATGFRKELGQHVQFGAELSGSYLLYTLSQTPTSMAFVELDLRLAWGT